MNRPTSGEAAAQLAANPKLMQAYRCIQEAQQCLNSYIEDIPARISSKDQIWGIVREIEGVLPGLWPNLAELIVADIDAHTNMEGK